MDIEPKIKAIEELIDGLLLEEEKKEKVLSYCAIKVLCEEIVRIAKVKKGSKCGYLEEKVINVIFHSGAAAGLEDRTGHPASQHASWARIEADSMRGALLMEADANPDAWERI